MIGFIKNLFSGIISFVVGLLGGKKSLENKSANSSAGKLEADGKKRKRNGYFMELDEADEQKQSANGNQPAKVEKAKTPEPAAAKTAKNPEPAAAAKTAKPEPAKTTKQEPAQKAASNNKPVQVELVQTAEGLKAELSEKSKSAKPASAPAATNGQTSSENTFAPKYLTPTNSNSRRRPGPSMSNFLDMARQVKTPN